MISLMLIAMFFGLETSSSPCIFEHEGTSWDFTPLENTDGATDYEIDRTDGQSGTFYYNICNTIQTPHGMCQGGLAMVMLNMGMFCATVADETNSPEWSLIEAGNPDAGVKAKWQGQPCSSGSGVYTTTLEFTCDETKTTGMAVTATEATPCNFVLKIPSQHGCAVAGGLSGGSIFLIIFFVVGIVYLAGGIGYNHKVKGATGAELVPNIDKWRVLPGLVRDGCTWTHAKLKELSNNGKGDNENLL